MSDGSDERALLLSQTDEYGLTTAELQELAYTCREAKQRAYCPYSNFRVGCAILLNNGTVVLGANMENASYPVGTCAERVALGNALVNAGMQRGDIKAVAVTSDIEEGAPGAPCTPCGMCRQALREICDSSVPIFLYHPNGNYIVKTMEELLPMSFGPESLLPTQQIPNGC